MVHAQIDFCQVCIRSARSDSNGLLHHDRGGTTPRTLGVVIPQRMPHFMRDHVLAIAFKWKSTGLGSVHPSIMVQPNLGAAKNRTGQMVIFTPFGLQGMRATQADMLARSFRCDEGVQLTPSLGVGKVDRNLVGEDLRIVGNSRIHCRIVLDSHCVQNGKTFWETQTTQ